MVSALDSESNGPGSSSGRGHCVVFLGKTLYSHSVSLHPVQMDSRFMLKETGVKRRPHGPLGPV